MKRNATISGMSGGRLVLDLGRLPEARYPEGSDIASQGFGWMSTHGGGSVFSFTLPQTAGLRSPPQGLCPHPAGTRRGLSGQH